ncbi:MAG: DinB family protein [Pedobacter sp.]|nr:MAG: DinB family protein [Pedobacter sp.]
MNSAYTYKIQSLKKIRSLSLQIMQDLTLEQLNYVPSGINNNIIWNAGHLIAAQQGVCYMRAGLPTMISTDFYSAYKPGTKPEAPLGEEEVKYIKEMLLTSIDRFETDLEKNLFGNYMPWTTRYGVELRNIDEAVDFLPFHEGMHLGYMLALRRLSINS